MEGSFLSTYIMEAKGDRMRRPSRHNFNSAKPRCLSAFQPKAETIRRILVGKEDSNRCTAPILTNEKKWYFSTPLFFSVDLFSLPKLDCRYGILIHVFVEVLSHTFILLPHQAVSTVS